MARAYPLAALLRVRQLREEEAARAAAAARREALAARARLDQDRAELARYQKWRQNETDRRYREIQGRRLTRPDLDEFQQGLARLADAEQARAEQALAAERDEDRARRKLAEAAAAEAAARRDQAKIEAHRDIWAAAEAREAARLEDLEMEEFRPAREDGS